MTAFGVFVAAFMLLAGAAAAVILGQFTQSRIAPMISILYSAGAVACTVVAVALRHRS